MGAEIDERVRALDAGERGVGDGVRRGDEGDDRPVVRWIGGDIEDDDAGDGSDRVADLAYDVRSTTFRKIGNAFDQGHGTTGVWGLGSGDHNIVVPEVQLRSC